MEENWEGHLLKKVKLLKISQLLILLFPLCSERSPPVGTFSSKKVFLPFVLIVKTTHRP